jgi:hypothetical protein
LRTICKFCENEYRKQYRKKKSEKNTIYKCDTEGCNKQYKTRDGLMKHKKQPHIPKIIKEKIIITNIICKGPYCNNTEKDVSHFRTKKDSANGYQPWCKECYKIYKRKYNAKKKNVIYKCDVEGCEKLYKLKDSLTRHKKEKH